MAGNRKTEIVRYPDGKIVRVTESQLQRLAGEGIAFYDDDPVNPPAQWGYDGADEKRFLKVLRAKERGTARGAGR